MGSVTSSDLLNLMRTISPILNPFTFLSNAISALDLALTAPHYWKLVVVNLVIHILLALQAAIALTWKLLRKHDGERAKCWFWRQRHVFATQRRPYYEPNGNQLLQLCQLVGCICLEIYYAFLYRVTKISAISYSNYGTAAFWFTLSHLPGIMGFWFASWSALYLVLLCPQRYEISPTSKKNSVWGPLVMNWLCIGLPILLVLFFCVLGVVLIMQTHNLSANLTILKSTLAELDSMWTPVQQLEPRTIELLSYPLENLFQTTRHLIQCYQSIAFSWAIMSMLMLSFYCITMAAIWKILHNTLMVASGKAPVMVKIEKEIEKQNESIGSAIEDITQVKRHVSSIPLPDEPRKVLNPALASQLRRNYYFLSVSCTLMATSLACNIFFGLLLGVKVKSGIDIQAGNTTFALCTSGSLLSSMSLLLQSVACMIS
ncbi:hypothetical protein PtB15_8B536 [Puccinia triticina]|nr:hypothetical protein PtB15_8B536 [Puccinia triticina]